MLVDKSILEPGHECLTRPRNKNAREDGTNLLPANEPLSMSPLRFRSTFSHSTVFP